MKLFKLLPAGLLVAVTLLVTFATNVSHAQVLLSGGNYSQNFDSLATANNSTNTWANNVTLLGWFAAKTGGDIAVTNYRVASGGLSTGAIYSLGATNVAERCLGSVGSASSGSQFYGVVLSNDTATVLTDFTVSYTGEMWRNGGNVTLAAHSNTFHYRVAAAATINDSDSTNSLLYTAFSSLNFVSPTVTSATAAALDGNNAANQVSFNSILLTGVSLAPGQALFLRWTDINDAGNDHALGVDNLTVTFSSSVPSTPPTIIADPQNRTNNAGSSAQFTVNAGGSGLHFRWLKGATPLTTGGNILGAETATLTINNVLAADAANYSVTITNAAGATNSAAASLTVIDPVMGTQPVGRTNVAGDTISFSSSVFGTQPVTYQWYRGSTPVVTGGSSSNPNGYTTSIGLDYTNAQAADAGNYTLVAFNASSVSVTSSVAAVTIFPTPSTRLARWGYNGNGNSTTAPTPAEGTGSAALVGGTTATFAAGTMSDPAQAAGLINNGWNSAGYSNTVNKAAGIQFNVNTTGYQDVMLVWEQKHSATASKYTRLLYTTNGTDFIHGPVITMSDTSGAFVFYSANLASIPGIKNNASFAFRFVAEWEGTATNGPGTSFVGTAGTFGSSGTIRYDLVSVYANPVLYATKDTAGIILTWSNPAYFLQSAPTLTNTFTAVCPSTSPYTNAITGTEQYFRLTTTACP